MSFKVIPMIKAKNENKVSVSVTGQKNGGSRETIRMNDITYSKGVAFYEFSYVIPKIDKSIWSNVQL